MLTSSTAANLPPPDGRVKLDVQRLNTLRQPRGANKEAVSEQFLVRRQCLTRAAIKRAESGRPVPYRTVRHLAAFYGIRAEVLIEAPARAPAVPLAPPPCLERLQFATVLDSVRSTGRGRLVDANGPAASGKSRLLAGCAEDAARRGYACVALRLEAEAAPGIRHPLATLALALLELDALPDARAYLETRVRSRCRALGLPEVHVEGCLSLLGETPAWPPPSAQLLQAAALCALLQLRARRQPLLVSIDDMHRADWSLATMLNILVPATLDYPVAWMLASEQQPEPARQLPGVRLAALPRTTLHLAPEHGMRSRPDAASVHRLVRPRQQAG